MTSPIRVTRSRSGARSQAAGELAAGREMAAGLAMSCNTEVAGVLVRSDGREVTPQYYDITQSVVSRCIMHDVAHA